MAAFDMSATMDAMAEILIVGVTPRVYAWPTESVAVPCIVIGYPSDIDYDSTFARGSDHVVIPVYYVAGKSSDRNARDELSAIINGTGSVKTALDGNLDGVVNSCEVTTGSIIEININAIAYVAAKFDVEILS